MAPSSVLKLTLLFGLVKIGVNSMTFSHMTNRDVITLYTSHDMMTDWSQFSLIVTDRDFFSFQVRACADAHILIESILGISPVSDNGQVPLPQDDLIVTTELAIGAAQNSKVIVETPSPTGGDILAEVLTPNVLDCSDFRQFWLSWRNETFKVGRGPIYDQQLYLELNSNEDRFIGVSKLFLATTNGNTGMWRINENSGYSSVFHTTPTGLFSKVWRSVEFRSGWFPFSLQAKSNAMIGLGAQTGFADYQIILGLTPNTSVIQKNDETVAQIKRPNVLNVLKYLPFWVSWDAGLIQLGEGREKNRNILLQYQDQDFQNVGHIGFTTSHGVYGKWAVRETSENHVVMSFPLVTGQTDTALFVSAPMTTHIPFRIQACSDAQIDFTQRDGWDDDSAIKIHLGANNNTQIIVSTSFSPNIETIPKPDLLDCDSLIPFWASWRLGPLVIGQGLWEEQYVIMTFEDVIVPNLHSISFKNAKSDVPVKVAVDNSIGDELVIDFPRSMAYGQMFVSTKHTMFRTFSLVQKGGVQILLCETLDAQRTQRYEVVFSMTGKTIWIQRTLMSGTKANTSIIPVPLEDQERRPFWLSWYNNVVMVGEGHRYGERTLVSLSAGSPYPITALSPSTSDSTFANLQMDMDQDELLSVKIPAGTKSGVRWFRLTDSNNWAYVRLANDGVARLSLSTWYRSLKDEEYILSFGEGGENKVVLRQKMQQVAVSAIGEKWNKKNLRDFWISWEDNEISVGSSRYKGAQPFFSGFKLTNKLRAIGFYPQSNCTVEWLIPHTFGPEATVYTDADVVGENWFQVTHRTGLVFGVQACKNVKVYLAGSMYGADKQPYVVEIGGTNNVNTRIWADDVLKMFTQTKDILSCEEELYFWITWYEGAIAVGKGQYPGEEMILMWHGLTPHDINAITMTTTNATGKWRIGFLGGSLDPRPPPPTIPLPTAGALGGGAIAGIVIGCFAFVFICIMVAYVMVQGAPGWIRDLVSSSSAGSGPGLPPSKPQDFDNPIKYDEKEYDGE